MIRPFSDSNLIINIIISLSILSPLILLLFGFLFEPQAMKVHPMSMKRNITIRDSMDSTSCSSETLTTCDEGSALKRLRRLPHVFGKVLELPFRSDADVSVEESYEFFRFVALTAEDAIGPDVRARAVEIHPGVTKIVVRNGGEEEEEEVELLFGALEMDVWRFRLPAMTRPEMATAEFVDGELIVTVPKIEEFAAPEVLGGVGRFVLVR